MAQELQHTRVFLTGFMGCGKSTLGPLLAAEVGMKFVDLDEEISRTAGETIPHIFEHRGEEYFRSLESAALRALPKGTVSAVGGGALVRTKEMAWALAHGIVVYLQVPAAELQRRLSVDTVHRPLLTDEKGRRLGETLLQERINRLLQRRETSYERAQVTVDAADSPLVVVREIRKALHEYLIPAETIGGDGG